MSYINEIWFDSAFNNWHFFNNPSYANTNSYIINAKLKREYTKYYKCTRLGACKIFNCIRDYSGYSQKRNVYNKVQKVR
jgi:hypothetical protein